MPLFVLFALVVLSIFLGTFWGLVALATSRSKETTRRNVRTVAIGLSALGTAFYGYFVVLLLDAHFDTEDFWSRPEQSQLLTYTQACEGPLAPGTSVADVRAWLADAGILADGDPKRDPEKRLYFRESTNNGSDYHDIEITDRNVRNWSPSGDVDVTTHVLFDGGRVSRCKASLFEHGR